MRFALCSIAISWALKSYFHGYSFILTERFCGLLYHTSAAVRLTKRRVAALNGPVMGISAGLNALAYHIKTLVDTLFSISRIF